MFNSHYLAYFDVSITELWRAALPGGYHAMLERGRRRGRRRGSPAVQELRPLRRRAPARGRRDAARATTSIVTRHRICRGDEQLVEVDDRATCVVDSRQLRQDADPGLAESRARALARAPAPCSVRPGRRAASGPRPSRQSVFSGSCFSLSCRARCRSGTGRSWRSIRSTAAATAGHRRRLERGGGRRPSPSLASSVVGSGGSCSSILPQIRLNRLAPEAVPPSTRR